MYPTCTHWSFCTFSKRLSFKQIVGPLSAQKWDCPVWTHHIPNHLNYTQSHEKCVTFSEIRKMPLCCYAPTDTAHAGWTSSTHCITACWVTFLPSNAFCLLALVVMLGCYFTTNVVWLNLCKCRFYVIIYIMPACWNLEVKEKSYKLKNLIMKTKPI